MIGINPFINSIYNELISNNIIRYRYINQYIFQKGQGFLYNPYEWS